MKPLLLTLVLSLLSCVSVNASAAGKTWRFKVLLNGKPIGYHTFHVDHHGDTSSTQIDARFKVKILFLTVYDYRYTDQERWRDGCLRQLDSKATVNSKHFAVHVRADADGLELQSKVDRDSKDATLSGCVMTFAYWDPAILHRSRLLNSQTGEYVEVDTKLVGTGPIDVEGTKVTARHYRLISRNADIDLWYSPGGEWLKLETKVSASRTLRYQLVEPSIADLQLASGKAASQP